MRGLKIFFGLGVLLSQGGALKADDGTRSLSSGQMIESYPAPTGSSVLSSNQPAPSMGLIPYESSMRGVLQEPLPPGQSIQDCIECCDCCPEWPHYFEFDLLAMSRSNGLRDQPLVLNADDPTEVLMGTQDFSFGVAPGVRTYLGRRGDHQWGWELGYTGIYTAFADEEFASTDNLSAPGDLPGALPGWQTADYIDPVYKSSLNLFEANLMWSTCCDGCEPEAWLAWKRYKHCTCTDLIAGFIWAGLNESADYNVICCEGDPTSSYSVDTDSNLFGFQFGIRKRADWERWSLQGSLKGAVAGSHLQSNSSSIYSTLAQSGDPNDPLVTVRDPISLSDNDLAGLVQFNLTAIYRINSQWGLRAGYNLIGLFDVALAPDQWDFTDTAESGTRLYGGGDVLFHGANLGVEYRW